MIPGPKGKQTNQEIKMLNELLLKFQNQGTVDKLLDLQEIGRHYKTPDGRREIQDTASSFIKYLGRDRGGWPSATFRWRRRDMRQVRDAEDSTMYGAGKTYAVATPAFNAIRGISVEVTGNGGACEIVVDNLIMVKEGALDGKYYYKVALEDDEGNLSPSSEISMPVNVSKQDIYLTNIYVPNTNERARIKNKRLYRLGGASSEWRHVADIDVVKPDYLDVTVEEDLGLVLPEDAYAPPRARVISPIGNVMYYGDVVDRLGYQRPYRMYKSEAFVPGRVRDLDCIDLPMSQGNRIMAIFEYYNNIVMLTQHGMWTSEMGLSTPVKRSNTGCIARRSVVVTDRGIIWLSRDGLVIGNISQVDQGPFRLINSLFNGYTDDDLESAVGVAQGDFYYLFYDQANSKSIACYLPNGHCSTLSGMDVYSISKWDGRGDGRKLRAGTGDGEIITLFTSTLTDNGSSAATQLRTFFSEDPGSQFEKHVKATYITGNKMIVSNPTFITTVYYDASSNLGVTHTADSTSIKTYTDTIVQGRAGRHYSFGVTSSVRHHRISELAIQTMYEEDTNG
jgi:hypothetical protein